MSRLEVRAAVLSDAAEIHAIESVCSGMPWSRGQILEELQQNCACTLVARMDGQTVGFLTAHLLGDDAHINELGVLPAARRKGAASALMRRLVQESLAAGCSQITLEVRQSAEPAKALYARFGFQPVGLRCRFYQNPAEDAVVMLKQLEKNCHVDSGN